MRRFTAERTTAVSLLALGALLFGAGAAEGATVTPSVTSVSASNSLSVSWDRQGTPTSTDWIGLYRVGDPSTGTRQWWSYVTTVTGTKTLTAPAVTGNYEFRYFSANSYTLLATSAQVTVTGSTASFTLVPTPTSVATGGALSVAWTMSGWGPTSTDWIGLFRVGDPNNGTRYWWAYTSGAASGSRNLTAPTTAGNYEFRLFSANSYNLLITSAQVVVGGGGPPAPTLTLTASPSSITVGQSSTLTWSTTNATGCTASNGWSGAKATNGSQSVSPTTNTTYTLVCTGPGGSSPTRSALVSVASVLTITTSSLPNGTVGIAYNSGVAAAGGTPPYTFSIINGALPAGLTFSTGGALFGTPTATGSASLTFRVTDTLSATATRTLGFDIVAAGAPTATLSANPTSIQTGQSSTLTWGSTNATSCSSGGGFTTTGATSGSASVSPTATTTYTVSCTGPGGTSPVASATVTVTAGPVITVTPSVTTVATGGAMSVSWTMTGRTPTSTDWVGLFRVGMPNTSTRYWWAYTGGLASGSKNLNAPTTANQYEFRLFAQNSYTLLATSVPVQVGGPQVPTATLTANPAVIGAGQSTVLTWGSTNATSCASGGGFTTTGAISGTATVSPASTTTYTVNCTGAGGTSPTASATVTVNPALTPRHNLKTGTEVYNYVNLAWGRYFDAGGNRWVQTFGMDFGACPLLDARRLMNNPQVATDLDALATRGVQGVRWWVIPDGRNLTFNASRQATGRGANFRDDLHRALDLLSARNMGVIITLIDGNTWFKPEGTYQGALFGHAQSITNATKRQALYNTVIIPILQDLAAWAAAHPSVPFPVTAIDLMNEPYFGSSLGQPAPQTGATMAHMQTYARETAALVRTYLPGVPVTIGEAKPGIVASHWTDSALGVPAGQGLDFFSFHHFGPEPLEGAGGLKNTYNLHTLGKRIYLQEFPTKTPPLGGPQPYLAAIGGTRGGQTAQGYLAGSYPWSFTAQGDPWTADDPLPVLNQVQSWYGSTFNQPDLAIGPITIPILQNGSMPQFMVPVVNQGGVSAGSNRFELWIDGVMHHSATLPTMLPGEFVNVIAPTWTATTGGHNLWTKADVFLQVTEPDELNNEKPVPFTVFSGPLPDLVVSNVTIPSPISPGQSVTITVQVRNLGTASSNSNRLEAWLDGVMLSAVNVPALAPQGTTNLNLPAWTATAGSHSLWVKVDIFEIVNELDDANNERNTNFFVQ